MPDPIPGVTPTLRHPDHGQNARVVCPDDANLGHGVLAPTDPDVLRRLVDAVHEITASFHTD